MLIASDFVRLLGSFGLATVVRSYRFDIHFFLFVSSLTIIAVMIKIDFRGIGLSKPLFSFGFKLDGFLKAEQ